MDILNINFNEGIPDIIDAYTEVFGQQYRNIITQRLNNARHLYYINNKDVEDYYNFLRKEKDEEFCYKFLVESGLIKPRKSGVYDGLLYQLSVFCREVLALQLMDFYKIQWMTVSIILK